MKTTLNTVILFFIFFAVTFSLTVNSQVITTTPVFPIDADSCIIIFDAAQGDAGLKDVITPIYAHTGVITNLSTSPSDWKYAVAGWSQNLPKALLTSLGNNKFKLTMKPSIRGYYGVPVTEQILKMAFVFRNADGSKTGRNADGGDVFADVYTNVMSVNIALPANKNLFLKLDDPIPVSAISPMAETMKLFVNGTLVKTSTGQYITDTILADNFGQNWVKQWVRIEAHNSTGSVADSFCYTVIPPANVADLPPGIVDGINYTGTSAAVLCLYAPGKTNVFATGEFNNWQLDQDHYMNVTTDGKRYWLQLNNLVPKQEYIFQYVVDGNLRIGDPYCDKVSDPNDQYISPATYPNLKPYPTGKASGIASFLQTDQEPYGWNSTPFTPPQITDLVIYELLIRDFTTAHDYPSLIDTLDYLKRLGVNAIELMPVMEFEGNQSWGYNPDFSFAVDKYYGTKNGLKKFVEACHLRGIAVILDIVCNHHFGSSPLVRLYWDAAAQRPALDNPWFNPVAKHPYSVGYDFNHESAATKTYMERLLGYWLTEFHIDGYRFDLSKGFTQKNSYPDNVSLWGQYDASRILILKNYTNIIHSLNPNAFSIMEHFADNSEEKELAANSMLPWGNMNYSYIQAGGGWTSGSNSDLSWGSYKQRGWTQPNLVAYMESHDEERGMFKNISAGNISKPPYSVRDTNTALKRIELNANFFFTIPGPKMIWQFGELGYDYSITYGGDRLAPKPVRWDYQNQWRRRYTKNVFSALTELKKTQPVFATTNYTIDLSGTIKRLWLRHTTMDATVLGNFDVISRDVTPDFTKTGKWYEFYTGDSLDVQNVSATLKFNPGEYRIYTSVKLTKPIFTGIDENDFMEIAGDKHIFVYPNPSDGLFNVIINLPCASKKSEVTICDIHGKITGMVTLNQLPKGISEFTLNMAEFTQGKPVSGVYFIRIAGENYIETGKIVVK
ncbi:MAG: alpha-amylase family glycosyl hydrolase [Bacteroidetes bacterium]|nr:alpha-amylase family glycosyl hydrolase [Bacteroidota bacterium]